jgi:acyl-CoA thioesterase FadM
MLLFFRVVRVLLACLFGRRIGLLEGSALHFRVWPTDIDLNFHLNDGRYVSLAGLGRINLMARTGLFRAAIRRRWYPVVGGVVIRYRREIGAFQKFVLHTRVVGWDEKWLYFEHRFESAETLAAIAYVRGVLRTRKGPVPSADVVALFGANQTSPPLPEPIVRWREANIP